MCILALDGSSVHKTYLYICLYFAIDHFNSCLFLELHLQNQRLILWYVIVQLFSFIIGRGNKNFELILFSFLQREPCSLQELRRKNHNVVERLRRSEQRGLFDKLVDLFNVDPKTPRLHLLTMVSGWWSNKSLTQKRATWY